jgi:hypothetical protein
MAQEIVVDPLTLERCRVHHPAISVVLAGLKSIEKLERRCYEVWLQALLQAFLWKWVLVDRSIFCCLTGALL